jgi:acyl carrier protein
MTTEEIQEQVKDFLINNFIFDPSAQIGAEDSLMENGVVDSTGILEVIMWVEQTFGIHVEDSEVLPENFDSIRNIARYAQTKIGAGAENEAVTK